MTRVFLPAGTAVTCSVPAAVTRRSQCQASSCSSPAASVRPATAACSSARLPWTWSWTNPSRPAPTECHWTGGQEGRRTVAAGRRHRRTAEEEHRSYAECPMYFVCVCVWCRLERVHTEDGVAEELNDVLARLPNAQNDGCAQGWVGAVCV